MNIIRFIYNTNVVVLLSIPTILFSIVLFMRSLYEEKNHKIYLASGWSILLFQTVILVLTYLPEIKIVLEK